jgi:hypothetical protein
MLVRTWKLTQEEIDLKYPDFDRYGHRLLIETGDLVTVSSSTERLEDDPFWEKRYERIELK